jgi:hypothetical protein
MTMDKSHKAKKIAAEFINNVDIDNKQELMVAVKALLNRYSLRTAKLLTDRQVSTMDGIIAVIRELNQSFRSVNRKLCNHYGDMIMEDWAYAYVVAKGDIKFYESALAAGVLPKLPDHILESIKQEADDD